MPRVQPPQGAGDDSLRIAVICEDLILEALSEHDDVQESKTGEVKAQHSLISSKEMKVAMKKKKRIKKKWDEDNSNMTPEEELVVLEEVRSLAVSYRNILKIDNLGGLEGLHTLCLDNNIIEEICNLEHLVNLEWLDLSFNNISKIEGLEKLTKLKDLSLYNNNIETIENLDQCTALECLSIGNNKLNKLENIVYLRQFKNLRVLTIEGNPLCSDPECRPFILAYLPVLKYLDYALVDEAEVISAREQNQDELLEANEREALEEAKKKATDAHNAYMKRLKQANLVIVETLFTEMFSEDKDVEKIKLLPGFDGIFESYQHEFRVQAESSINKGLELHELAKIEIGRYRSAVDRLISENEKSSIQLLENFNASKKKMIQTVKNNDQEKSKTEEIQVELEAGIEQLQDELMTIEIQQLEQLINLRDTLENRTGPIKNQQLEMAQVFLRSVEDLENSWFSAVEELAQNLMEKLNNGLLEDVSNEVSNFLSDRDTILMAIQGSHDVHLGKLLAQEDAIRDSIISYYKNLLEAEKRDHVKQNRARVGDIMRVVRENKQEIISLGAETVEEDD